MGLCAVPYEIKAYHHRLKPQAFYRLARGRRMDLGKATPHPIPSAPWSALLPFFKGEL